MYVRAGTRKDNKLFMALIQTQKAASNIILIAISGFTCYSSQQTSYKHALCTVILYYSSCVLQGVHTHANNWMRHNHGCEWPDIVWLDPTGISSGTDTRVNVRYYWRSYCCSDLIKPSHFFFVRKLTGCVIHCGCAWWKPFDTVRIISKGFHHAFQD
jgi:hypothetical protein